MSNRLVRTTSLWSKIKAYPLDLLLELNEQRELIDWDSYSETIALPLGFILTILYFFVRLWQDNQVVEKKQNYFNYDNIVLKDSKYFQKNRGSNFLTNVAATLQFIIIAINAINTLLFLFKTKTYSIFNKDTLPNTTSAIKVSKNSSASTTNFIQRFFQRWFGSDNTLDVDSYWELKMWNPSKFSTYLFVSFPPFNIGFLYLSASSFKNLIFLFLTSFVLYIVIIRGYIVLINDKQVLFQETFDEYERKFVRPKLSIAKREVSVDATKGPYSNDSIHYYSPGRTEKLFRTHDSNGRESVEVFEHGAFSPLRRSSMRKSIIGTPIKNYQPSPLARKTYRHTLR